MSNGGNTDSTAADSGGAGWDFFISYTQPDRAWAEWIAWTLEEAGWRVLIQAWDFTPGSSWVAGMDKGVAHATRTVAVLSAAYSSSVYGAAEWQAAWQADPTGRTRKLLVARVEDCPRPGLLGQVVSCDLFGSSEEGARAGLLRAAQLADTGSRGKPKEAPVFPPSTRAVPTAVPFPGELPAVWNMPPRLAHFTGRDDLLDELQQHLSGSDGVTVCALQGLGGIGKTALAIEYAYRRAADFDVVWWTPAEDLDVLAGHVAALGVHLGLSDGAGWATVVGMLRRERLRWLLILDNVEDLDLVGPFRPSDLLGRLVITSRRHGLDGFGRELTVPDLPRHEAINLLTRRIRGIAPTQAGKVAELLGDLPLAIEQAAGYLSQTRMPPEDYIQLLTNRLGDMLGRGRVADRPDITIANLWKLSLSRLHIDRPASVALLEMCALCAPEPIPLDLINDHAEALQDGPIKEVTGDVLAWAETVGALVDYSLVRRDGPTITAHRLTSAAVQISMTIEQQNMTKITLLRLMNADLPADIEGHPEHWPRWRSLIPHLRTVLDGHGDDTWDEQLIPMVAWLCDRAGGYLLQQGQPSAAIRYIHRGLSLVESRLGPSHPIALSGNNHLAQAYASAGQINRAISVYESTLTRFTSTSSRDDIEILTIRANLADAYRSAGQVDQAITIYEQVIPEMSRLQEGAHPSTLAARNNLGYAYTSAGRFDQAINTFKQNVNDCLDGLGPDHQSTMAARGNLADAYFMAGQTDQAIGLLEQTLADNRRILGTDNPHTLTTRARIADAYQKTKTPDQVISLYEQIYSDGLRILGSDHPETLTFRSNLALTYGRAKRIDKAIELLEQTLADRLRVLGPSHPDTELSQRNLAAAKRARSI